MYIEKDMASVDVIDKDGEKSFMEIPKDDFEKFKIEFKPGIIFSFILKQFLGWEKLVFKPVKRTPISRDEWDKTLKYYEEKYGDV